MDWQAACAAVIPCLNEEETIAPLVEAVRRHVSAVFVVDDGSSDATAERARCAGATVLRHSAALGKGAALRAGWIGLENKAIVGRSRWMATASILLKTCPLSSIAASALLPGSWSAIAWAKLTAFPSSVAGLISG
jgi:hypothetical protein